MALSRLCFASFAGTIIFISPTATFADAEEIKKSEVNPFGLYSCTECAELRKTLNEAGRARYDDLSKLSNNKIRCESMAYIVMLNILTNNAIGVKHQLATLGSCDNCLLNYKLTKLFQKMEEIGEVEGINYYRVWVEDDIWNLLSLRKRWTLYHEMSKSWIWSTFAALIGLSPMVFKSISKPSNISFR